MTGPSNELEDKQMSSKHYSLLITATIWAGWTSIMLPRMVVTALLPTIEPAFHITHAQGGLLMTSYLYPYALMQIPIGALSDRFGRKRFMVAALSGSSLASLALLAVQSFEQMVVLRVVAGFFAGLWYAPAISLLTVSVSDNDRGKAMGVALSGPLVSDALIFLMVGTLGVESFGWRSYFLIYAIPGFICALGTWFIVRHVPGRPEGPQRTREERGNVWKILLGRDVLGILAFNAVLSLGTYSLRTFLPVYFVQARGLSSSEASLLMMAYATAVILASPLAGYLVDRFGSGRPSLVSLLLVGLVTLALPMVPMGLPAAATLFVWGLTGGWITTALSVLMTQIVPARVRGTFLGVLNACVFFGAATGPVILGYVADIGGFSAFFASALGLCALSSLIILPVLKAYWRPKSVA